MRAASTGNVRGPEPVFTVEECARHWRVSRRTVDRWIASGRLRVARMGSLDRVPQSDKDRFMTEHLF